MLPVLYTIGAFNVYSFGVFLAIAFILSTFVIWKLSRQEFKEEVYLDAYFYTAIVTLFFARVIYILRNFQDFNFMFLKYFLVVETPGLSMLGGAIAGLVFLYFYSKRNKINFYHTADIFAVAGSLGLIFVKIGQQLGGAAFGRQTEFVLKVRIAGRPGFYHPAELYESLIYLFVFIAVNILFYKAQRQKWQKGIIFAIFAIFVAITTIALEFLKVFRVYLYEFSFRQILGLLILFSAVLFILVTTGVAKYLLNFFKKAKNEISKRNT